MPTYGPDETADYPLDPPGEPADRAAWQVDALAAPAVPYTEQLACPDCGKPLLEVRYPPGSYLNEDQWHSIRAGDYYCVFCRSAQALSGYRYFWARDLSTGGTP